MPPEFTVAMAYCVVDPLMRMSALVSSPEVSSGVGPVRMNAFVPVVMAIVSVPDESACWNAPANPKMASGGVLLGAKNCCHPVEVVKLAGKPLALVVPHDPVAPCSKSKKVVGGGAPDVVAAAAPA